MIKKYILIILGLFLPILVVFGTYRVALGYAPLNTKALVETLSLAFTQTSYGLVELFELIEEAASYIEGFIETFEEVIGGLNYSTPSLTSSIQAFLGLLVTLIQTLFYLIINIFDLLIVILKIVGYLLVDILGLLKVITAFLVDSSPYQIDPYYKPIS